jgi:AcrR family transcriptional regulator
MARRTWGIRQERADESPEETRRAILRTAQRLFMEQGYRAVSTRQIAAACGLTQPALYHHFADKEEMYVAVLLDSLDEVHAGLERIAARGGDVAEKLRQVVRYLPGSRQDLTQMFHDLRHELRPEVSRRLYEAFEASMIAPIVSIFADGLRRGALRPPERGGVDAVTAAYLLLHLLQYQASEGKGELDESRWAARRAEVIVGLMLRGLAEPGRVGEKGQEGEGDE